MEQILETMEDIKQNIKDNEYKTIMDGLMKINIKKDEKKEPVECLYKMDQLLKWLNTKIEFTNDRFDTIPKKELKQFIIKQFYNDIKRENIKTVSNALYFYFPNDRRYTNRYSHVRFI